MKYKDFLNLTNELKAKVISLDCSNNNLSELPDLSKCTNLTHLNCSDNNLSELPDLSKCTNLTYLYCYNNNLSKLPDLSKCTNLTYLYCYNNNLSEFVFSDRIGSRVAITEYWITNDRIQCGCFFGTLKEFEDRVNEHHVKGCEFHSQYMEFISKCKKQK